MQISHWDTAPQHRTVPREGKLDNDKTFPLDRYLYVDVQVDDVGGKGDSYCSVFVKGGFKVRVTTTKGKLISSPQITQAYAGGFNWKRVSAQPSRWSATRMMRVAKTAGM